MKGSVEIIQYIKSMGGAPFLDSSWDEKNFHVEDLFAEETLRSLNYFLNHWIEQCPHPKNKTQEIVCLRYSIPYNVSNVDIADVIRVFKELKIDEKLVRSTYQEAIDFATSQVRSEIVGNPSFFTISSFNNYTNNTVNWLKIINSNLTMESQLAEDAEIFVENPELIVKLLDLIKRTPKG